MLLKRRRSCGNPRIKEADRKSGVGAAGTFPQSRIDSRTIARNRINRRTVPGEARAFCFCRGLRGQLGRSGWG